MNNFLIAFVLFFFLVPSVHADFQKGMNAYQNKSYKTAFEEFKKSAEQGHAGAQYNLGVMYGTGQGVAQNYKEAAKWYRRAAEQGISDAQKHLGKMYYKGSGVAEDKVLAHMWFNIAASSGDRDAGRKRDFLSIRMTASQIKKAQEMAREWMEKHQK
ncbi:MAG: tetratricopeptide repeat protein [Nitrospinales bacterium]